MILQREFDEKQRARRERRERKRQLELEDEVELTLKPEGLLITPVRSARAGWAEALGPRKWCLQRQRCWRGGR